MRRHRESFLNLQQVPAFGLLLAHARDGVLEGFHGAAAELRSRKIQVRRYDLARFAASRRSIWPEAPCMPRTVVTPVAT